MKAASLHELGAIRAELVRRREESERSAREAAARRLAAERQKKQFALSVGAVLPIATGERATVIRTPPEPVPRQRDADERAALQASFSDTIDIESLLLTDDGLSFRRHGVSTDIVARLRRGQWAVQSHLDLHGLRRDEARDQVASFIRRARSNGLRCLRVVHGKGNGSPGREPILKSKVQRWLAQCNDVLAFTQASGHEGGAGALIVLLS